VTFVFARQVGALDYRHFFRKLLGPFWFLYELAFILMLVIVLAVFGAAAGKIIQSLTGLPPLVGTLLLVAGIALFTALGNDSVEALFKWVSLLLYSVYALFVVLALVYFGDRIDVAFANPTVGPDWVVLGVTYAAYNIVGAIMILPVTRHLQSDRDAIVAGLLAGPMAMIPALLFFICMVAWPEAAGAREAPTSPATARIVTTYGSIARNWLGTGVPRKDRIDWRLDAKPNSSDASSAPMGFHRPKISAARAATWQDPEYREARRAAYARRRTA
jgi:uncharacterized membrane protein YkvI